MVDAGTQVASRPHLPPSSPTAPPRSASALKSGPSVEVRPGSGSGSAVASQVPPSPGQDRKPSSFRAPAAFDPSVTGRDTMGSPQGCSEGAQWRS